MCSVGYNFESCNINYCQPEIKITVQQKPFSFYWRFKYHIRKEYLGYFLNGLGIYFYRAAPRPSQRSRPKHRQDVRSVSEPMTFSTRIASTTCTAQTIQRLFLPLIQVSVPFRILTFDVRIKEALVQAFDAQIAIAPRHRHGRVHFHATAGSVSTRRRGRSSSVNEQQRFRSGIVHRHFSRARPSTFSLIARRLSLYRYRGRRNRGGALRLWTYRVRRAFLCE